MDIKFKQGGQNPGPEALPRSQKRQERREQRRCQKRSDSNGAMEKSGCVRVIEGKEISGYDPVKYFLPTGVGSTWVPEGVMVIEVAQDEEISGGGKNAGRKGVGSAIC